MIVCETRTWLLPLKQPYHQLVNSPECPTTNKHYNVLSYTQIKLKLQVDVEHSSNIYKYCDYCGEGEHEHLGVILPYTHYILLSYIIIIYIYNNWVKGGERVTPLNHTVTAQQLELKPTKDKKF